MNYQKLAKVLLRIIGVWGVCQSLPQLVIAVYSVRNLPANSVGPPSDFIRIAPVVAGTMMAVAVVLFIMSGLLARWIVEDEEIKVR